MALPLSRLERQVLAGFAVSVVIMAVLHEVMQLKELGQAIRGQLLEDYYTILNVPETASSQEIGLAFKRLTNQLHSKPQDEALRLQRARIVTAHETLASPRARLQYDQRRKLVRLASDSLTLICVGVPVVAVLAACFRLLRHFNPRGRLDPASFEGRVAAALQEMEASVQVVLQRGTAAEKLGMQVIPTRQGKALCISQVDAGSVVEAHNQIVRTSCEDDDADPGGVASWQRKDLSVGDVLVSINGQSRADLMMQELNAVLALEISVRRPMAQLLAWVAEVELRRIASGERWGCRMREATDSSDTMEVESVEEGPLARWNRANPLLRVGVGDRVLAVNRQFGRQGMLSQLQDADQSSGSWLIVRGLRTAAAEREEVTCGPFQKREGEKLGIRIGPALDLRAGERCSAILDPSAVGATVVREVVGGLLVDRWSQQPSRPKVKEGAVVLAVNGRTDPQEFAAELSRPSVALRLQLLRALAGSSPPGGKAEAAASAPHPPTLQLDDTPPGLLQRLGHRWLPRFLQPASFEVRLRHSLSALRSEFRVELEREGGAPPRRVGLQLQPNHEGSRGLAVVEVLGDGLAAQYNRGCEGSVPPRPPVQKGDILVRANDTTASGLMLEKLSNPAVTGLSLTFSRKAALSSPGVWEVDLERQEGEGWGMHLLEQSSQHGRAAGVLQVDSISEGLAMDRWNQKATAAGSCRWAVQHGDLLVACEPDVVPTRILARLKRARRVRLTMLRWFSGPAPVEHEEGCADAAARAPPQSGTASIHVFEVTLVRVHPDEKLGVRLDPSSRDPTRTVVSSISTTGLVQRHNQRVVEARADTEASAAGPQVVYMGDEAVLVGDEVESINGERDPSRFGLFEGAESLVLRLVRREDQAAASSSPPAPGVGQEEATAAGAKAAEAVPEVPAAAAGPEPSQPARSPGAAATAAAAPPAPAASGPDDGWGFEDDDEVEDGGKKVNGEREEQVAVPQPPVKAPLEPQGAPTPGALGSSAAKSKRFTTVEPATGDEKDEEEEEEELAVIVAERDELRLQNVRLQAEVAHFRCAQLDMRHTAEEIEGLRREVAHLRRRAEIAEHREEEQLQERARQAGDCARLASQNERLHSQVAELESREQRLQEQLMRARGEEED